MIRAFIYWFNLFPVFCPRAQGPSKWDLSLFLFTMLSGVVGWAKWEWLPQNYLVKGKYSTGSFTPVPRLHNGDLSLSFCLCLYLILCLSSDILIILHFHLYASILCTVNCIQAYVPFCLSIIYLNLLVGHSTRSIFVFHLDSNYATGYSFLGKDNAGKCLSHCHYCVTSVRIGVLHYILYFGVTAFLCYCFLSLKEKK